MAESIGIKNENYSTTDGDAALQHPSNGFTTDGDGMVVQPPSSGFTTDGGGAVIQPPSSGFTTDGGPLVIQPLSSGFTIEQLLSFPQTEANCYTESHKPVEYVHTYPMHGSNKGNVHHAQTDLIDTGLQQDQHGFPKPYQLIHLQEDIDRNSNRTQLDISSRKRSWQSAFPNSFSTKTAGNPDIAGEDGNNHDTMFEIVVKAIMSVKCGEVLLGDIYNYIVNNYAKFRDSEKTSWRVTVRHALSVNSCFVKGRKAKNGRGFYWKIHPACLELFSSNELDRKKAAKLVQQASAGSDKRQQRSMSESPINTDDEGRQYLSPVMNTPNPNGDDLDHDDLMTNMTKENLGHVRHYVPMTTIPLTSYKYYELLVNLCELRDQQ